MKNLKSFEQFINENYNIDEMASFAGRAWSGKLENLDSLFSWMYDKGILNKTDKAKKDSIFRQYYRYYNDGDFPSGLVKAKDIKRWDTKEDIEKGLEEYIEDFMKSILAKYAGKYDRRDFHFDKLLGQLYQLQRSLVNDDVNQDEWRKGDHDNDINSFMYFYKKLGKVDHPEFDKLVNDLEKAYNKFTTTADKQIEAKLKENPDLGGWGGLSTNKIVGVKKKDMQKAEIWTDANQKYFDTMDKITKRLYIILGDVIEATNKAKATIG